MRRVALARFAAALAVAALAACASGGSATDSGGAAADPRPAMQKVLDDQVAAWNRGDIEAFMDGYWESPDLVFTSGGNVQRGWQTTLERYRASYGTSPETMGRLSFSDLEIHPLGDEAAWALGRSFSAGSTVTGSSSTTTRPAPRSRLTSLHLAPLDLRRLYSKFVRFTGRGFDQPGTVSME